MTATRMDIEGWLERAKEEGATHLIVACDTSDHDNYPVFVMPGEDVHVEIAKRQGQNMQTIDEVYDMSMDIDAQLAEHRAWHV